MLLQVKQNIASEFVTTVVSVFLLVLLFAFFAVVLAIRYWKRKRENEEMRTKFEQELLRTQMEIQEQTFTTISQEIHDNVGQTLSLAKVQVSIIDQSDFTDKQLLSEVKHNIGKAMNDLRDLAKSLNSDHIRLVSLKDLIVPELARLQRSRIVGTGLYEQGEPQPVAHQKKLILFRIVQESLQNIVKHAAAQTVDVRLKYGLHEVEVIITDDGQGFNPETVNKAGGLGLQNIAHRAALIGGKAVIRSRPGEGTSITLNVPYA